MSDVCDMPIYSPPPLNRWFVKPGIVIGDTYYRFAGPVQQWK